MPGESQGAINRHVRTLFTAGAVGGLTDSELLRLYREGAPATAEDAFAIIVERHSTMIFGVCRSVLKDAHDAEDAVQATFLILAYRAGSIRSRGSVGSWLHGVARRVAAKARARAALRRVHERRSAEIAAARVALEPSGLLSELYVEIDHLPERFRAPIVLCDLEGHSYDQAAKQLGLPLGTVQSRLARGRARLRLRLTRRGFAIAPASRALVTPVAHHAVAPLATCEAVVRAAARLATGEPVSGIVADGAIALVRSLARSVLMTRLAMIGFGLAAVGLIAIGAGVAAQQQGAVQPRVKNVPVPAPAPEHRPDPAVTTVFARVVDAHGHPVPGAMVRALGLRAGDQTLVADALGRVQVLRDLAPYPGMLLLMAVPDNATMGWATSPGLLNSPTGTADTPLTITLLPRHRTVEGSVIDVARKPVAGVRIEVGQISNDIDRFANHPGPGTSPRDWPFEIVTDDAGRFSLALPEGTVAFMHARHPRYASPGISCGPDTRTIAPVTLLPGGSIIGTVTDCGIGRRVEGVMVGAQMVEHRKAALSGGWGSARSDSQGRFEIEGLGSGVYNVLFLGARGGRRAAARAIEGVRVQAGHATTADLTVIEGRRLTGTVVLPDAQGPLGRVGLGYYGTARPQSGAAILSTQTDNLGRFELCVPPGKASLYVMGEAGPGGPRWWDLNIPEDHDPEPFRLVTRDRLVVVPRAVHALDEGGVEVVVKRRDDANAAGATGERTLEGQILDRGGLAIPGVCVVFNQDTTLVEACSDRDGRFVMEGLPAGAVSVYVEKRGEFSTRLLRIDAGCKEVAIHLAMP